MDNDLDLEIENEEIEENKPNNKGDVEPILIVGIRFKKNSKTYYFDPAGFDLKSGDRVIMETTRGNEYGYVVLSNRYVKNADIVKPLRPVIRMATEEDTAKHEQNLAREVEAFNTCLEKIETHNLEMKLIDVEFAFDGSKLLFSFSAEGRIDFRELVRELASIFHTRIEMRQIGIRDEAKILGGLGICGRPFCCCSFLDDFVQVSVKMAKEQSLSLNSTKISGACGRLMCCLRYEYNAYLEEKSLTPKVGTVVMTPDGEGVITEANPMAGVVRVRHNGKSEDDPQTIYVREDVVDKTNYNGEKLEKSELPNRIKKHEDKSKTPVVNFLTQNEEDTKDEQNNAQNADNQKQKQNDKSQKNTQNSQQKQKNNQGHHQQKQKNNQNQNTARQNQAQNTNADKDKNETKTDTTSNVETENAGVEKDNKKKNSKHHRNRRPKFRKNKNGISDQSKEQNKPPMNQSNNGNFNKNK